MRIHLIAIGGSAMHNLAIALKLNGYKVTGSDDEIFEPSKSRLKKHGLLPNTEGWDENRITKELDAVILGMHARKDNPELIKSQTLGMKIYSYPEYIYEQTKNKVRVVIGGSHGKTTITSMILHVLQKLRKNFDFLVGAQLDGFETMVRLSKDSPVAIIEGDEYLASPIDRRPKFLLYKPNIALVSGIAWDHINVFPTFDLYIDQFKNFVAAIEDGGSLVYCASDAEVKKIAELAKGNIRKIPYNLPSHTIINGITHINYKDHKIPLQVFGDHNLTNLEGARLVCELLGITSDEFYQSIASFKGASKRLELIATKNSTSIYKDFAHSPSKLKATIDAVRKQFPEKKLIACMELHTFSSLNEKFLDEYHGSMSPANEAIVYYNPHTIAHKKLPPISIEQVKRSFGTHDLQVFQDSKELINKLEKMNLQDSILLLMTSGNFDGINLNEFANKLLNN